MRFVQNQQISEFIARSITNITQPFNLAYLQLGRNVFEFSRATFCKQTSSWFVSIESWNKICNFGKLDVEFTQNRRENTKNNRIVKKSIKKKVKKIFKMEDKTLIKGSLILGVTFFGGFFFGYKFHEWRMEWLKRRRER